LPSRPLAMRGCKLAGEIQPYFRNYWEQEVLPEIDGELVQYVGEADTPMKNELLSHARALLFPIQWNEPFGLVMIEAMACGTPVIALPGGSVSEIVRNGVSGWICNDVGEMAERAVSPSIEAASCRAWAEEHFSYERMVDRYVEIYARVIGGRRVQRMSLVPRPAAGEAVEDLAAEPVSTCSEVIAARARKQNEVEPTTGQALSRGSVSSLVR